MLLKATWISSRNKAKDPIIKTGSFSGAADWT